MIRVFLADDHEIVLGGLRRLIAETPDLEVVGTATDGRQALQRALREGFVWDVMVLDLSLPRVAGAEVLRRVKAQRPEGRVIVLSMYPEEQYAAHLIESGADAYLSKASAPERLLEAIRVVASGDPWSAPTAVSRPPTPGGGSTALPHRRLSSREHQVFTLVIEGQRVTDIAAQLDLSTSTVSNHVAAIKAKLEAQSIADIIVYAHRVGLID
ncbi:MAG: response regulator transcription factor [Polyangiales bacterium]